MFELQGIYRGKAATFSWNEHRTSDRPDMVPVVDVRGEHVSAWSGGSTVELHLPTIEWADEFFYEDDDGHAILRYDDVELRGPASLLWTLIRRTVDDQLGYVPGEVTDTFPLTQPLVVLCLCGNLFDQIDETAGELPSGEPEDPDPDTVY